VNTSAQAGSKKRTPKTADLHHSTEQYPLPDPSQKAHNAQKPKQASHAASLSGKRNDPNQPTSIAHKKTDPICSTRHRIFHQEPEKIPDQNREEGNKTRKGGKKNNNNNKKKEEVTTDLPLVDGAMEVYQLCYC
jgi:hypothetical protein